MIGFEHVQDRLPQQSKVFLREAGRFARKIGRYVSLGAIESIGNDVFAAHLGAFALCVGFGGDGYPGNGDLLRQNGIDRAGKAELHRPAHLAAVEVPLYKGGHHGAEGADIEKVLAHEIPHLCVQGRVCFFCVLQILAGNAQIFQGFLIAAVQGDAVFYIDAPARGVLFGGLHIIADLALQADVGDEAIAALGVDTRHVARVRVAVGVTVFHIEQDDEFITVFDNIRHFQFPPFWNFDRNFAFQNSNQAGKNPSRAG